MGTIKFGLNTSLILSESRFGAAFMMDTGSSTGEIMGHSKVSYMFEWTQ